MLCYCEQSGWYDIKCMYFGLRLVFTSEPNHIHHTKLWKKKIKHWPLHIRLTSLCGSTQALLFDIRTKNPVFIWQITKHAERCIQLDALLWNTIRPMYLLFYYILFSTLLIKHIMHRKHVSTLLILESCTSTRQHKIIFPKHGALWWFWIYDLFSSYIVGKDKINCINFSFNMFSFQIVKLMKPIVAASSHVLGNKNVDEGEDVFVTVSFFQWPFYSLQTELNPENLLKHLCSSIFDHFNFLEIFFWKQFNSES